MVSLKLSSSRSLSLFLILFLFLFQPTLPAFAAVNSTELGQMDTHGLVLNNQLIIEGQRAIGNLDYAEMARDTTGTVVWPDRNYFPNVRVDLQNPIPNGGRNIQVQTGRSTMATVVVDGRYVTAATPPRMREVEREIRNALERSLDSVRRGSPQTFWIRGDFSN